MAFCGGFGSAQRAEPLPAPGEFAAAGAAWTMKVASYVAHIWAHSPVRRDQIASRNLFG